MGSDGRRAGVWWGLAALAAAAALLAPASVSAAPTTHTLAPTADTYLRSNQVARNLGTDADLQTEPSARQTLIQFDISGIPAGELIVSAKLRLYVTQAGGGVQVHRATTTWTELGATWSSMNANYAATVWGSGSASVIGQWLEIDLTSLVRAWRSGTANYGLMLIAPGGAAQSVFVSREGTVGQRPELVVLSTAEPSYSVTKLSQVISDPANGTTQPKRMPGAVIEYSLTVSSTNSNISDNNSVALAEALPAQASLFVGDLGGPGSGPVTFSNGSPTSGLSYTFSGLSSTTDDLSFSNDGGVSYAYVPVADANGYDSAVTHLRIAPKGIFAGSTGSGDPSFSYAFRARNK